MDHHHHHNHIENGDGPLYLLFIEKKNFNCEKPNRLIRSIFHYGCAIAIIYYYYWPFISIAVPSSFFFISFHSIFIPFHSMKNMWLFSNQNLAFDNITT